MKELHKVMFATLVAEIILSTFKDTVKERLDPSEWPFLDNNTLLCILDQLNGER